MFKNVVIFRISPDFAMPPAAALEEALGLRRFQPCAATQQESWGWVEPRGQKHGALVEAVGGEYIVKLMAETRSVPASVVKDKLHEKCEQIESEMGRKPGSKQKKELKEEIVQSLLPHAFPKKGATLAWISPKSRLLVVEAGSVSKADGIASRLIEAMAEVGATLSLTLLQSATSPAAGMSEWLTTKEPPPGFSVDRECELKAQDGDKASVRYSRHTLDMDEVVDHIQVQGKIPTKLAMTCDGRVSFVLAGDMTLKKVELLDVVLGDKGKKGDGGDFDADVAIVTSELGRLIAALIDVLGGEQLPGADGAEAPPAATQTPGATGAKAHVAPAAGAAPWSEEVDERAGAAAAEVEPF